MVLLVIEGCNFSLPPQITRPNSLFKLIQLNLEPFPWFFYLNSKLVLSLLSNLITLTLTLSIILSLTYWLNWISFLNGSCINKKWREIFLVSYTQLHSHTLSLSLSFSFFHTHNFTSLSITYNRVCHGFRFTDRDDYLRDNYFRVDFDHFWSKHHFLR